MIGKSLKGLSLVLALACVAALSPSPTHAAINLTLQTRPDSILDGASCAASSVGIEGTMQGTDDDRFVAGFWYDYVVFIMSDAYGTPLIAVWISVNNPSGIANLNWNGGDILFNDYGNVPAARPFHLDYYDIGDPGSYPPVLDAAFLAMVKSTYSPVVSQTFDPVAYGITACSGLPLIVEPIDDRLNYNDVSGPVAIYCNDPGLDIYAINPDTGKGHLVIRIEQAVLDELPDAPDATTLLASEGGVSVYQLTTGELQVVAGPDFEGKMYGFVFNGCPYEGGGYRVDVNT